MSDVQAHDLDALLNATGEFSFSPDVSTVAAAKAAGFVEFGNIVAVGFKPESSKEEHRGSYRGVRRKDKTIVTEINVAYSLQLDEINYEKWKYLIFGSDDSENNFAQSSISNANADVFNFAGTPAVAGRWYDITNNSIRVRELSNVQITGMNIGTDFFVDLKTGRIRFAAAQSSNVTPRITCPAVAAGNTGSLRAISPGTETKRSGIGRLMLFDNDHPNTLVYDHADFGCDVYLDSSDEFTGEGIATMKLVVQVANPLGTVWVP